MSPPGEAPTEGAGPPAAVAMIASPDAHTRERGCRALADEANATGWLTCLAEALGDPERRVRRAASDALAALAPSAPEVEQILRDALRSPCLAKRFPAVHTLARMGALEPALLPTLAQTLASEDADERWAAARLLVDLGRQHGEVARAVHELAIGGATPVVQRMALFSLRELAPREASTADALLTCSRSADTALVRASVAAMAGLPSFPDALTARLREMLEGDAEPGVRALAALALGAALDARSGIRGDAARAPLLGALEAACDESHPRDLRRAAERALTRARRAR